MTKELDRKKLESLSIKQIEEALDKLEKLGFVWKRWDIVKNDYIWYKTEFGSKVAKDMKDKNDKK